MEAIGEDVVSKTVRDVVDACRPADR